MTNETDKWIEEVVREFEVKFAKISYIHRGECAITDITGTKWQAHTENGIVTEIGGLESVKDFLLTTLHAHTAHLKEQLLKEMPKGKNENHFCPFNDGEQSCDCYSASIQDIREIINKL